MVGSPHRACGNCTACCIAYDVPQLNKEQNVPCQHLCATGCSIYNRKRPEPCGTFQCLWLQGYGAPEERPDQSNRILSYYSSVTGEFFVLQVACMGDYRPEEREVQDLLEEFIATHALKSAIAAVTFADGTNATVRRKATTA